MADKATKELERIYTIPLRDVKSSPRNHRTDRAVRAVKAYLTRHMKASDVWIDTTVNEKLWERGMYKLASKIRVRALKFDDGVVEVTLPEADVTTSRREAIKQQREERAKPEEKEEKKEEAKAEEQPPEAEKAGAEKPEAEKKAEGKPEAEKKAEAEPKEAAPKSAPKKAGSKTAGPKKSATQKDAPKSKKD